MRAMAKLRIEIRARPAATAELQRTVRERLTRAVGHWGSLIERMTLRFEDVNGPKGGLDTRCAIHVAISGLAPLQVELVGADRGRAFAAVAPKFERAVRKLLEKRERAAGRASVSTRPGPRPTEPSPSLIGRREGRGAANEQLARDRPDKARRDAIVDTAQPGVSASDRVAGGGHSARRNARKSRTGMTVTLEDSLTRPSRKSTRKSKNRAKVSQGKERTALAKALSPTSRARRGRAARGQP